MIVFSFILTKDKFGLSCTLNMNMSLLRYSSYFANFCNPSFISCNDCYCLHVYPQTKKESRKLAYDILQNINCILKDIESTDQESSLRRLLNMVSLTALNMPVLRLQLVFTSLKSDLFIYISSFLEGIIIFVSYQLSASSSYWYACSLPKCVSWSGNFKIQTSEVCKLDVSGHFSGEVGKLCYIVASIATVPLSSLSVVINLQMHKLMIFNFPLVFQLRT